MIKSEIGCAHAGIVEQIAPGSAMRDTTGLDHITAVGNGKRGIGILLHQQHRNPLPLQSADDRKNLVDQDRRKPHRRLVEQDQFRFRHQCAAHRQHLLLSARQVAARDISLFSEYRKGRIDTLDIDRDIGILA